MGSGSERERTKGAADGQATKEDHVLGGSMPLGIPSFAAKNAVRHRSLAVVTVGVVALGIGLFSALAPILENMVDQTKNYLSGVGDVTVLQNGTNMYTSQLPENLSDDIGLVDGVKAVEPQITILLLQSQLTDRGLSLQPNSLLLGLHPERDVQYGGILSHMQNGRRFVEGKMETVVGSRLATLAHIDTGSSINLGGSPYTVVGIYSTGSMANDAHIAIPFSEARNLTKSPKIADGNCSVISVKVKDLNRLEDIANRIKERFGVETSFPKDTLKGAMSTITMIETATATVSTIVLLSSFIITTAILYMNVKERQREFAMLKAIGWSNRNVLVCVLLESLVLAIMGGALGLVMGTVLTIYLQKYILGMDILFMTPRIFGASFVLTVFLALFSGAYPAYIASRAKPAVILREG